MNTQDATSLSGLGSQFQTTPRALPGFNNNALGTLNQAQKLQLQAQLRNLELVRQQEALKQSAAQQQQQQQQQFQQQQQQQQSQAALLLQQQLQLQQQQRASAPSLSNILPAQNQLRQAAVSSDQMLSQRLQQQALAASLRSVPNQVARMPNGVQTANGGGGGSQVDNLVRLLSAQQQARVMSSQQASMQQSANMQSVLQQARQQPAPQNLNPQLLQTLANARNNPMLNSALRNNLNTLNRPPLLQPQANAALAGKQAQLQQVLAAVQAQCSQVGGVGGVLPGQGGQSPQEVLVHLGVCFARLQISVEAALKAELLGKLAPQEIRILAEAHTIESSRMRNGGVGPSPQDLMPKPAASPLPVNNTASMTSPLALLNNSGLQQLAMDRNPAAALNLNNTSVLNAAAQQLQQQQQQQLLQLQQQQQQQQQAMMNDMPISAPQFSTNIARVAPAPAAATAATMAVSGNALSNPMISSPTPIKVDEMKLMDESAFINASKEQSGFGNQRGSSPTGPENRIDSQTTLGTDLSMNSSDKLNNVAIRFDSTAYSFFGPMAGGGELLEERDCLEAGSEGALEQNTVQPIDEYSSLEETTAEDNDLDDLELVEQVSISPSSKDKVLDKVISGFDGKPSPLTIVAETVQMSEAITARSMERLNGHPQNKDITDQDMYDRFRDIGIGFE